MKYIILAAGQGTRLRPVTKDYPKVLFRADGATPMLRRLVSQIKRYDADADVVIVTGYMHDAIECELTDCRFVHNPFFEATNSVASLWFARDEFDCDCTTVLNGDLLMSDGLVKEVVCKPVCRPTSFVDTSRASGGDYCAVISGDRIVTMAKGLMNPSAEYMSFSKFDRESAAILRAEIERMVDAGEYDQWYENALVNLIFRNGFALYWEDEAGQDWCEVDSYDDLFKARRIAGAYGVQ